MAQRKPRIRKTAPTIRERVEAAQAEADKPQAKPRLSSARARGRSVFKIFRPLKRPLRWLVPRYFINAWRELRLVTWPSRRETWRLTGAVVVFAIVFGALVAGVDFGIDKLFKKVVLK